MASEAYVPGVCNINVVEIAYRRNVAIGAYILTVLLFGVLWALGVHGVLIVLILFLPLFVAVINTLQVRNKFCVSYGASGRQNASEGSRQASEVANDADRQADKAKSKGMNLQALAITVAVLLVTLLLLVL